MKLFLSGATGVLGRRIIAEFTKANHTVVGVSRSEENDRIIKEAGGIPKRADLLDADSLEVAAKGCDVFVHAATQLRTLRRPTRRKVGMNDLVRRAGAAAMAEAAQRVGAKQFLYPSIVWLVRPDDGSPFTEDAMFNPDRITSSSMLTERLLSAKGKEAGFTVSILRLGFLYSADSSQTRFFAKGLAKGRMGPLGEGKAEWSMLHADDAASAFMAAARHGKGGLWHVVDDKPVPSMSVFRTISDALGAPQPKPVPLWLGYLVVGRLGVKFFRRPTVTSNQRFKRDTGWKPKYATIEDGVAQVVRQWRAEGFPPAPKERTAKSAPKARIKAKDGV